MAEQLTFDLPVRTALGREDFFVAPSNASAVAMLDGAVAWPGGKLALVGPAASGKSHLVQVWAARTKATVLPAAALAGEDIGALGRRPHVAVEDVPAIAGDRAAEEALFHLHNHLLEQGGQLLVTGRDAPAAWCIALPDLASRLRAAPLARLDAPDDALLAALLFKQFADRQMQVPDAVIAFLLPRMRRNAAAAAALVETLDHLSLTEHQRVAVPLARRALAVLEGSPETDVSR